FSISPPWRWRQARSPSAMRRCGGWPQPCSSPRRRLSRLSYGARAGPIRTPCRRLSGRAAPCRSPNPRRPLLLPIPFMEDEHMNASLQTLDVRPTLRAGGEPFQEIMQAVASLDSGQGLRLLATFRPVPLFKVMQNKGYAHSERPLDGGDWEVIF